MVGPVEDLKLEVGGMMTKPYVGRRLDDNVRHEHLDRAVLELQTLGKRRGEIIHIPPLGGDRYSI